MAQNLSLPGAPETITSISPYPNRASHANQLVLFCLLSAHVSSGGAESTPGTSIPDQPSPQVTVRHFSREDAAIPPQLAKGTGEPLPVAGLWAAQGAEAKSGATWLATPRGLLRLALGERRAGDRARYPLWHFIYRTANPAAKVDLDTAVHTLERIPLNLVNWSYDNSARADMVIDPALDRFRRAQSLNWLPPDERAVMKWNGNPFRLDGGREGLGEDDGGFYILPYWLGRYHRFISGPASR